MRPWMITALLFPLNSALHAATVDVWASPGLPGADTAVDTGPGWRSAASAEARAGAGWAKLMAQAEADWVPAEGSSIHFASGLAQARADWVDVITIDGEPAGTTGELSFQVLTTFASGHGLASAGLNPPDPRVFTQWTTRWFVNDAFEAGCSAANDALPDTVTASCTGALSLETVGDWTFARATYTTAFQFGTPFEIRFTGTATAQAAVSGFAALGVGNQGHADALLNLGQSMYWDGIAGVTVGGAPVAWTVNSVSGVDYSLSQATVPVPEAGTAPLLGLGMLGLLGWLRRMDGPRPARLTRR